MEWSCQGSIAEPPSANPYPQGDRDQDQRRPLAVLGGTRPRRTRRSRKFGGMVVGRLVGFEASGTPLVDHAGSLSCQPLPARSTVRLDRDQIGQEVALMFDGGDPRKPVVMGVIQTLLATPASSSSPPTSQEKMMIAEVDGKRLVLTAEHEIVLRCGEASITLTRAGKVLIRGTFLSSRASGVNRISGGSVQIN